MNSSLQVDAARVIEIIREENPMVLELAMRRALIEQQEALIEQMKRALGAPLGDTVHSPGDGSQ